MYESIYRRALRMSWDLAWHHKFLWVFGMFATILGQMGILELLTKVGMASSTYALFPTWLASPGVFKDAAQNGGMALSTDGWVWFVCLLLIFVSLAAFFIFTAVSSQGALIRASAQFSKKETLPSTSDAWTAGTKHFWKLLGVNVIKKLILVILTIFVGWATLPVVVVDVTTGYLIISLLVFILAAVVGMVVSFLAIYTAGYIVVEEYPVVKAIESAWRLFLSHWLVSAEVALLVLFFNFLIGLIAVFALLVVFFPVLIAWMVAALTSSAALWMAGLVVGLIFFTLFIIFLGSVFTVFTTSVWTNLFMKMHREGIRSRIVHVLSWRKGK